jgi:flagellar motility protein MotE (MotC chaperone)
METKTVAKINNVEIVIVKNGKNLVPIKPICEALGIDYSSQLKKLKSDDFLSSVVVLNTTTASDNKNYEMVSIELEFVFGWLFTINPKNVKEESQVEVAKFRIECYKALFSNFVENPEFLEFKQQKLDEMVQEMEKARLDYKNAQTRIKASKEKYLEIKALSIEEWRQDKKQMSFDFIEE